MEHRLSYLNVVMEHRLSYLNVVMEHRLSYLNVVMEHDCMAACCSIVLLYFRTFSII